MNRDEEYFQKCKVSAHPCTCSQEAAWEHTVSKKKGYDKPRQGKAGFRKQKDQDKVLREVEKGDVGASGGQGTADTVQNEEARLSQRWIYSNPVQANVLWQHLVQAWSGETCIEKLIHETTACQGKNFFYWSILHDSTRKKIAKSIHYNTQILFTFDLKRKKKS